MKLRAWLAEDAGEFNGVAPYAPRGEVIAVYAAAIVLLALDIFVCVAVTR